MKKVKLLSFLAFITSVAVASSASAAKDSYYVGLDLNKNTNAITLVISSQGNSGRVKDSNYSFGLVAGHKFNLSKEVFLAPELFYDRLGINDRDNFTANGDYYRVKYRIKDRVGIRLNLGYNINNQFAVYGNAGYASVTGNFKTTQYTNAALTNVQSSKEDHSYSKYSAIYGAGLLVNLDHNISLKAEFNRQDAKLNETTFAIKTYRVGAIYNF